MTKTKNTDTTAATDKPKRGFAALEKSRLSEIAKRGGQAAHEQKVAHTWNSDTARAAGKLGGRATHANKKAKAPTAPAPMEEMSGKDESAAKCGSGGSCGSSA